MQQRSIYIVSPSPIFKLGDVLGVPRDTPIKVFSNLKKCTPAPYCYVSLSGSQVNNYQTLSVLSKSGYPISLRLKGSESEFLRIYKFPVL